MCLNATWFYRDIQEWAQQGPEVEENTVWVEENPCSLLGVSCTEYEKM